MAQRRSAALVYDARASPGMVTKKRTNTGEKAKAARSEVRAPRRRRAPEEARAHLLDAAERVFSQRGPDAVGLRDVAREAGVSHGLITHYFKTYEGLVEAVFKRRADRIAERVVTRLAEMKQAPSAAVLVEIMLGVSSEPIHLRLVAWSMLSGRALQGDFVPNRSLELVAAAIHKAATSEAKRRGTRAPSRDDVDYALLLMLGAAYGWGLGKAPFLAALGRKATARTDAEVMSRLTTMVQALLAPPAPG